MKEFRHLEDVATLVLDETKCIGCSLCTEVCPHQVLEMHQKKAKIIDFNACMECGACVNNCPSSALTVNPGVG
ncbi:MAG: 4Fe-4S dicluster domain-containing protein [Desulfobacteraceae bacterium]|nr:4Fe-4S dicluster domain-containing protein [Desulfobacteraceae bacterium]